MINDLVGQLDTRAENSARSAGIIIGWYSRGVLEGDAALLGAWKSFRKAKPFWA